MLTIIIASGQRLWYNYLNRFPNRFLYQVQQNAPKTSPKPDEKVRFAMNRWINILMILAIAITCVILSTISANAEEYRTLKVGDSGEDVIALKTRMYELGYFSTDQFSDEFNKITRDRLKELQKKNKLKADGIATPEVQALIFSDDCLPKNGKAAKKLSSSTPAPAVYDTMPELDEDGYLPTGLDPYVLADRDNGIWIYISQDIHLEIRQHSGTTEFGVNLWLEAILRLKDPSRLISMVSGGKKPGNALVQPQTLTKTYGEPIFAFNDDFFGYRVRYKQKAGVIIRDGIILYDQPKTSKATSFPPLDIMAVFSDGTMKTFDSDEHTAQEYIDMGVRDTYAFGPVLVRDGQIVEEAAKWGVKRAPRLALGMTADGSIVVVDALGRRNDARGVSVGWMAEKMHELGCTEALNLDGGNTTCMLFMGDMINRPVNVASKNIRYITGLIAVKEEH